VSDKHWFVQAMHQRVYPFTLSNQNRTTKNIHVCTILHLLGVGWADLLLLGRGDDLASGPGHGSATEPELASGPASGNASAALVWDDWLGASSAAAASFAELDTGHGIGENKGVAVELAIMSDTRKGKGYDIGDEVGIAGRSYQPTDAKDEQGERT
jgi:hypothetical protein